MRARGSFLLAASLTYLAWAGAARAEEPIPPGYANVEVISIDAATRIVIIRNSKGQKESFVLDDTLGSGVGVKAGDRVMVTVRGEPGRKRITAITKAGANPAPVVAAVASPIVLVATPELAKAEMRERFAGQVATLAQQARPIDSVWSSFVTSCDVRQSSSVEGGRDWFGLWDGRVKADLSGGFCRDLFNQIVSAGEGIKKGMAAAEDVARPTVPAGEMREIRKLNSMDWDGWALAAPAKLEP